MANLLNNPNLGNWQHSHYFTSQDGRVGTVEIPAGWKFTSTPKESDPNRLPESLHRDNGFLISAAYIAWEGGYVQSGVQLQANQRYLAKATFKPDVNFPGGQQPDLTAITWCFRISSGDKVIQQDWTMTNKEEYKQQEEHSFVFQSAANSIADIGFIGRSVFAGNDCDFFVYSITLEPVAADFGPATVPVLGQSSTVPTEPVVEPEPVTEPEPEPVTEPAPTISGTSGKSLGEVLSNEDIDQITSSLRALASENGIDISLGLHKLADGLEKLKG